VVPDLLDKLKELSGGEGEKRFGTV